MNVLTLIVVWVYAAFVLSFFYSAAAPVITGETKALMYLQKYGYMEVTNPGSSALVDGETLSEAIKDFQRFTGLPETGILDKPTLNIMDMPRCGVPDKVAHSGSSRRKKRYALAEYKWNKRSLTYKISKYPSSIKDVFSTSFKNGAQVDEEIAKAFKVWSNVTSLKFEVSKDSWFLTPVHIDISFEKGKHGPNCKFDGPKGTLAHAFFPQFGGDVHFDDEENWTIHGSSGINFLQVAVHELGHSLGLDHSNIKSAVMFPFYRSYKPNFALDKDDVLGIQEMYGPPPKDDAPEPWSNPDASEAPDLCRDPSIDAATVAAVNDKTRTYVFKGNYYWEIEDSGISDGYPRKISEDWPGLPGDLDAAMTVDGKTYFFKKNQFWRFHNGKMDSGYPKNISAIFPSTIPNDIDTVFYWLDGYYFFKGAFYWKCHFTDALKSVWCKPRQPISNWEGLPIDIEAAFRWNQKTYIFKGGEYYRISNHKQSVDDVSPPYPRSTSVWWFDCSVEVPDLCQDSSINATTTTEDGQIYIFKGNYYWKIEESGISEGYPREISLDWSGLSGNLDAAITSDGKTYFFKKNLYWRFQNKKMDSGYPKNISDSIPGIPNDIDAAFYWSLNDNVYFFKGNNYWRLDYKKPQDISSRYPQPISNWNGLPNNIDAALRWRNNTYFFKGSQYYKWNDKTASVVTDPPYPRSTYIWWFDCENWKKNLQIGDWQS